VTTGLENQNSGEFTSRDISEEKVVELTKRRSSLRQHVCPLQFIVLWCLFLLGMKVKSVPIELAQCRFSGLAVSNAKISIYCSYKIY